MSKEEPTDPAALADELERLGKEATPVPWLAEPSRLTPGKTEYIYEKGNRYSPIVETDSGVYGPTWIDAQLIVALRNAAPSIVQHLRSLAELREQREGVEACSKVLFEAAERVGEQVAQLSLITRSEYHRGMHDMAREIAQWLRGEADHIRDSRSTASPAPGKEDQALTNNRPKGA